MPGWVVAGFLGGVVLPPQYIRAISDIATAMVI
jgi:hypothetical protein